MRGARSTLASTSHQETVGPKECMGIHKTKHCETQGSPKNQCNVRPKDHLGTHKFWHCEACVCNACDLAISSAALHTTQTERHAKLNVKRPSSTKPLQSTTCSQCNLRAAGRPQNKALRGPRNALPQDMHCEPQGVPWSPSTIHPFPIGLEVMVLQQLLAGLLGAQLAVTIVDTFITDAGVLLPHLPLHVVFLHVIDAPVAP